MGNLRTRAFFFLANALLCSSALLSQGVAPEARINAPADESSLTVVKGSVPSRARARFDRGAVSRATELAHIRLVLSRTARQQAALDAYLAELQDKSSPNYHRWLTPEQFGKLYGPADSDVAAIEAWLGSHGLKVDEVSAGRTDIAFSGTVTQVEQTLHTSIHSFDVNGEKFFSNTTNPKIPAAFSAVVRGIARLDNIKPKPLYLLGQGGKFDPATRRMVPDRTRSANSAARAQLSYNSGGSDYLVVAPADAATIYNTPNTKLNANYTSGSGSEYTGAGVVIGMAGDSSIAPASVVNYRSLFVGDSAAPTITNVDQVGENSDAVEAFLDTEVAGGLAPGASIHLYVSSDLYTAIQQAINDNKVDIFNLSFGECEADYTTAYNAMISGWWEQAAAQGIAVTVSTGDSGSAGCDVPIDGSGNYVADAQYGLGVNGLGSTPFNISVGGTDYYSLGNDFGTYATVPDSTDGSSAGSASTYFRTAKSYIPESTWNDATETNGTFSANVPITPVAGSPNGPNIFSGGGGKSSCSTNTGTSTSVGSCTSGYSKPAWQRGTGVPADGVRDLPDVSLLAGDGFYGAYWLICYNYTSGGTTYNADCTPQSDGSFNWGGVGGTSAASPAFAGILALVQQKTGGRLGQAAKELYDLYNGSHASTIFHDVTVGNISVPCTGGTPDCSANTAGYDFLQGYDTTAGYDLATGMGSTDVAQLVANWGTETGASAADVSVTPSAATVTTVDPFTVAVSVAGSGSLGTPTGTVTLSSGSYSSGAQTLDAAGSYTFDVAAGNLAIGSDILTATYSGDPTYATTTKTVTVQVNGLTPTVTVTPSTPTLSSTATLDVAVTVAGASGSPTPTGTVTLSSGTYSSSAQQLTNGSYSFTIPANSLSSGSNTITVAYSGDGIYAPATGDSAAVTVTSGAFTLSATTPAAVTSGSPATSTVTVAGSGGYAGTVTLACTLTASPSGATTLPTCTASSSTVTLSASATSGTATMTVSTSTTSAALRPGTRRGPGWAGAGSGLLLACLALLGIPARRRGWRSMLGCAVVVAVLASLTGCSGFWDPPVNGSGITTGAYTFTVTGTGNPSISQVPSTTFIVTVQ
jgi:hypothetical protein